MNDVLTNPALSAFLIRLVEDGLFPWITAAIVISSGLGAIYFAGVSAFKFLQMVSSAGVMNFRERLIARNQSIAALFAAGVLASPIATAFAMSNTVVTSPRPSVTVSMSEMMLTERTTEGAIYGLFAGIGYIVSIGASISIANVPNKGNIWTVFGMYVMAGMLIDARDMWAMIQSMAGLS